MNHQDVCARIGHDEIDILVDLAGHAGNSRLPVFFMKPAPIQVTYLGYPNTTGFSAMDYRLTDGIADPPDQDRFYTERLYRLPECFLCYRPPPETPLSPVPPADKNGYITFGSFNNFPKISGDTVCLWAGILHRVKNSRLVIKSKQLIDPAICERLLQLFAIYGIGADRLELRTHSPSLESHLSCYNGIDIALDTFPYNGTTTTCEALWMGVPVITLAGDRHASRVGASLLAQAGLTGLVAQSAEHYISLAAFLAGNISPLSKLKTGLRGMIAQSPLCDGAGFTKKIEKAYGEMWDKQ
jgi:predicted O-linked N-acetylglucosamine transferase (SPINDLY family)